MMEPIPDTTAGRVKLLETVLIKACHGQAGPDDDAAYVELRRVMMRDTALKPLLPDFVRTCRDGAPLAVHKGCRPTVGAETAACARRHDAVV